MDPTHPFYWDTKLGKKDDIDRVILRQFYVELGKYPLYLEESTHTSQVRDLILNTQMMLSEKAFLHFQRGLPASWDGTQFVSIPVYLEATLTYFSNV